MNKPYKTHEEATAELFRRDPEFAESYREALLADGDEQERANLARTFPATID